MKKLIEKRAMLKAQLQAMLDKVKTEERAFTEEETAEFDKTEAEIKSIDATIAAEERAKGIGEPVSGNTVIPTENTAEVEERAFRDYLLGKVTEMRAGEQNVTMTNNGAIIPDSIANRIIDEVREICPILEGCDLYRVKGTFKIPKWTKANDTHDITVGYASEFTELTADSGKFTSVDLGGYLVGALTLVGRSVQNNASFNIVAFVIRKMAEKIAEFIEKELLTGAGSNSAEGALKTSNNIVAGSKNTISFDDLVKLQSSVKQVYQGNACWTMSNDTFTLIKLLKDTNGRPLLETDSTKSFPHTLLGKPVYISDNMPAIAAGAKPILYGDYSGLSVNIREDISIEVLREKYATQHALGIVAWFEFDSKITDEQKLAVLTLSASS